MNILILKFSRNSTHICWKITKIKFLKKSKLGIKILEKKILENQLEERRKPDLEKLSNNKS